MNRQVDVCLGYERTPDGHDLFQRNRIRIDRFGNQRQALLEKILNKRVQTNRDHMCNEYSDVEVRPAA